MFPSLIVIRIEIPNIVKIKCNGLKHQAVIYRFKYHHAEQTSETLSQLHCANVSLTDQLIDEIQVSQLLLRIYVTIITTDSAGHNMFQQYIFYLQRW